MTTRGRAAGAGLFLAGLVAAAPPTATRPWIQLQPKSTAETALREAFSRAAFNGPEATAQTLLLQADGQPGTTAGGLARLAAGYLLVDSGHPTEAIAALSHADIRRTALADYAQFALGRAWEAQGNREAAGTAYAGAAQASGNGPPLCAALRRAADMFDASSQTAQALTALERLGQSCPGLQAQALLRLAELKDLAKDLAGAAAAYDRLDREFPAAPQAASIAPRLLSLAALLPAQSAEAQLERRLRKGLALLEADQPAAALVALRAALASKVAKPGQLERAQLGVGRALLELHRSREAMAALRAVPPSSPHAAEAHYRLAKLAPKEAERLRGFEAVATQHAGTPWGEEALLGLANHYQKDLYDTQALPYFKRLLDGYPQGRYADRATWRVGWGAWRAGRSEAAALIFERAVQVRPVTNFTPGFLYWAGRARQALGQTDRARGLFEEAVRRFKRSYHGARAAEALERPRLAETPAGAPPAAPEQDIPEPQLTRITQLLLIDRQDEALEELRLLPAAPAVHATIAWLETRRGRLRPAITAMKRAFPEHIGASGDALPDEVWRILYPLEYRDALEQRSREMGLDPSLVAALVCQESTFDAGAVSRVGARGLMQIMPATGRALARSLGTRYSRDSLHDPETSLEFGTRYLRDMLDRFSGAPERALAAYNAGPHRVDAWTAGRPDLKPEEFVENIPFTETRGYVMTILAAREQYRRIYGLGAAPLGGGGGR